MSAETTTKESVKPGPSKPTETVDSGQAQSPPVVTRARAGQLYPVFERGIQDGAVSPGDLSAAHLYSFGHKGTTPELAMAAFLLLPEMRAAFEARNGRILHDFWCHRAEAGGFMTERQLSISGEFIPGDSEIADLLDSADRLWTRSRRLDKNDRRLFAGLLWGPISFALTALDHRRADPKADNSKELGRIRSNLAAAEAYFKNVATTQATVLYFIGMLYGIAMLVWTFDLVLAAGVFGRISGGPFEPLMVAFGSGALGAVVSVLARMSSEEGTVQNYEASRGSLRVLGALRPVLGALFGSLVLVYVLSGLVPLAFPADSGRTVFFVIAIGFLAGFSERWAKDILAKPPAGLEAATASVSASGATSSKA